jgi:hypothetical protein
MTGARQVRSPSAAALMPTAARARGRRGVLLDQLARVRQDDRPFATLPRAPGEFGHGQGLARADARVDQRPRDAGAIGVLDRVGRGDLIGAAGGTSERLPDLPSELTYSEI